MNKLAKVENIDNVLLLPYARQVEKSDLFKALTASIAKCFADLNKELPDDKDISYMINELTNNIIKNYPSIRLPEIPVAFANGIRGAYGKYYGTLSVITFEAFIAAYLESEERVQLVKQNLPLLIEEKAEPTRDEKFNIAGCLVIDLFEYYKKNGSLNLSALTVYEFTKMLELIGQVSRKGVYKEATAELIKEKTDALLFVSSPFKRNVLRLDLETLKKNIELDTITIEQHEAVIRTGKRLIVRLWFDELIADGSNITELLEAKRTFYIDLKKEETHE